MRTMEIGRTVHIIDKDLCVRGMLEQLLYSAGYDYDAYQSIPEFLEAASAVPSGCVLLDVAVPDSNSLELPSRLGRLVLFCRSSSSPGAMTFRPRCAPLRREPSMSSKTRSTANACSPR